MTLVGVVDVGGRCPGEARPQAQGAHATDAEEHLLLEALLATAAVEAVGDVAGGLVVVRDVGVEQQQRHATDLGAPHVRVQLTATGQGEGDDAGRTVLLAQHAEGQSVGVEDGVGLLLPAVTVEALLEVAGLVEQADADDRDPEVGGGLEVVTGEDAQAAGVLRQHLGDAELRAEVADGLRGAAAVLVVVLGLRPRLVPARFAEVVVQVGLGAGHRGDELVAGRQDGQLRRGQRRQQADRVLADHGPALRVDQLEHIARRGMPGPPQVARQVTEGGDRLGQDSADAEASNRLHEG